MWNRPDPDLLLLAKLCLQNESSFLVPRCVQRFEAGEMTAREAIRRIRQDPDIRDHARFPVDLPPPKSGVPTVSNSGSHRTRVARLWQRTRSHPWGSAAQAEAAVDARDEGVHWGRHTCPAPEPLSLVPDRPGPCEARPGRPFPRKYPEHRCEQPQETLPGHEGTIETTHLACREEPPRPLRPIAGLCPVLEPMAPCHNRPPATPLFNLPH